MAEIHEGVITDQNVGREPAGQGRPEDPALSSPESIKAKLTAETGVAAGMDYGQNEPTAIGSATKALAALTQVVESQSATTGRLTGELGVSEVREALDRGLPADEVLAAGLSSGALSAETAEELAWNAALAAQGLSEEELVEIDDDEWTLSEEIAQSSEQLMAQAKGLANQQVQAKVYSETYAQELDQGLKNHEQSVKALREYQQELGMNAETFKPS